MRARHLLATAFAMLLCAAPAIAEGPNVTPPAESMQIGLSTDVIHITADFQGADLTIFGALENPDPLISRQGRYDIVVVLEGPARAVTVRRKSRVLGIWMNTQSASFVNVPESYSISTTRMPQDITHPTSYRQLALGINYLHIQPTDSYDNAATLEEFTQALRARKLAVGLFNERIGGVQFLSANLFRATVSLAPDIPVGTHKARAFLFRNGLFVKETSAQLAIVKSGFEQMLFRLSRNHSLFYGFCAVGLAMVTGWLGRLIFRRD